MSTWLIGLPIVGFGLYLLIKSIKKEVKGECCGCSSCSDQSCSSNKDHF